MTRPTCVLVGPPGAGKTTVGQLLAGLTDTRFRDTDSDVEARAGRSIPDIFVLDGEPAFRALERQAVADALRDHDGVLAVGGGAILDPATRRLLHDHRVVYLETGLGAAAKRVGFGVGRPVLVENPRARLRELLDARRAYYEEVAVITVCTDDREPADVAEDVRRCLAEVSA